jgi:S-DNA-T family DNA segregation ATPase FtsK/SpoIIIE
MQLILVRNDTIYRLPLPKKVTGQYWITCAEADGTESELIGVEGVGDTWMLKSNKRAWVLDRDKHRIREAPLGVNRFYDVALATGERVVLRSEATTDDRRRYAKFAIPRHVRLTIGRGEDCEICYGSEFVSSRHAELVFAPDAVTITDLDSANGTFVNSKRVRTARLVPGDVVSVFGFNLIMGRGFVALNDPDGQVTLDGSLLRPLPAPAPQPIEADVEIEESSPGTVFFRSPRFKREIATAEIRIDPPPQLNDPDEMPLMMILGPAVTMGIASLFMGIFAVVNVVSNDGNITQALPTLIMSLSMMTGMILWPILARRHERRRRAEREQKRQTKYRAYIEQTRVAIETERRTQSEILNENIVTMPDCVQRVRSRARNLWERTADHNDFLQFRLGMGVGVFEADIKHAERKFTLEDDDLQDVMLALAEEPKALPNVPVALSLLHQPIVGLIGDRTVSRDFVRGIVMQLVALHSYDELKLVFIYDSAEGPVWEFARWLPHSWSDDKSVRFVATTHDDLRRLSGVLDAELARRNDIHCDEDTSSTTPHYVIFALDKALAGKSDFVGKVLHQKVPRASTWSRSTTSCTSFPRSAVR